MSRRPSADPRGAVVDDVKPMLPQKRCEDYVKYLKQGLAQMPRERGEIERALNEEPARTAQLP